MGILWQSSGGARNWKAQASGATNGLTSVCFADSNTKAAVRSGGMILRTTEGALPGTTNSAAPATFSGTATAVG
jgi:hypothetical protein